MRDSASGASPVPERLGPFAVSGCLGEGGSGIVYRARFGHREVALKVLREQLLAAGRERARFFDEARRLAAIHHPGVVKVLQSGELPDGRPDLAMELLPGEPLSAVLSRGCLSLEVALSILDQLAAAMAALHDQGLIHRDLKPENIFLADGEHAILLDFGIAKAEDAPASTVTQEGGIRGTPAYMAPERFFGEPATRASDVYELAVTFFVAITGSLPWKEAGDPVDRLTPVRPSERGAPPALDLPLSLAMSTRPEKRPRGPLELAEQVRAALSAGPSARATRDLQRGGGQALSPELAPTEAMEATSSRAPTRERGLVVPIAGGVLLIAAIALAIWQWPRGTAETDEVRAAGADEEHVIEASTRVDPHGGDDPRTPASDFEPREGNDEGFATAATHHPSDTSTLLGLRVRQLRQSDAFVDVFTLMKSRPLLAPVLLLDQSCGLDLFDDIDWLTLGRGATGTTADGAFDAVVAGNFTRESIEACAERFLEAEVERDGRISRISLDGQTWWAGWLDDETFVTTSRPEADRDWITARLEGEDSAISAGSPVSERIAEIDPMSTLWMAGLSDQGMTGEVVPDLVPPTSASAQISVGGSLDGRLLLHYDDQREAAEARAALGAQVERLKSDPFANAFLDGLEASVAGTDVVVEASLDEAMTRIIAAAARASLEGGLE